jgi:hypothetical protein
MRANMFAKLILVVTKALTESLVISALVQIHAREAGNVVADLAVERLERVARAAVGLADQDEIRIKEIADHAPQRDEFGVVAESEILAGSAPAGQLQRSANSRRPCCRA